MNHRKRIIVKDKIINRQSHRNKLNLRAMIVMMKIIEDLIVQEINTIKIMVIADLEQVKMKKIKKKDLDLHHFNQIIPKSIQIK